MADPIFIDGAQRNFDVDNAPETADKKTGPTTAFQIPVPTAGGALVAGDFIIANVTWDTTSAANPSRTLPSGWTSLTGIQLIQATTNYSHNEAIYHFVTAGEAASPPASWDIINGTAMEGNIAVSRFRNVDQASPFAMASPSYSGTMFTTGVKSAPAVTTDTTNAMVVTGGSLRNGSLTLTSVDPGYTIGGNAFLGTGRSTALAHKSQAAAGDSGVATWTLSATSNPGYFWQTALRPTPIAQPTLKRTVASINNVASTSATTGTLSPPATAGNLLIAHVAVDKSAGTFTTPAGWVALAKVVGASVSTMIVSKIAAGDETSLTMSWTTSVPTGYATTLSEIAGASIVDTLGPITAPAYDDTARTSLSLDPGTAESASLALAFLSVDTVSNGTDFQPTAPGWTLNRAVWNSSDPPGAALLSRSVAAGEDLSAQTFTWTKSDQVYGAVVLVNAAPAISTLTDDFATKNTARWWWDTGASVVAGQLNLALNTGYTGTIGSADRYNLTSSSATVELVTAPNVGNGTTEVQFIVRSSVSDEAFFLLGDGFLNAMRKVGGTSTTVATVAYSATAHRWLRIREAAGIVFWETSPDRTTWTIQGQWTATWPVTSVEIQLGAGYWGTETAPGKAVLDNFNVAPAATTALTVAYSGDTAAATLPADSGLTAGNITAGAGAAIVVPRASDPAYDPNKIWSAAPPASATNLATAITNNSYFEITLSRPGGMTLQTLRLKGARAGSSTPRGFAIRSSVDGYVADLIAADIATVAPTLTQYSADISALGTQTSVTFRVFYYAPTTGSLLHFDDLEVDYAATVTATGTLNHVWTGVPDSNSIPVKVKTTGAASVRLKVGTNAGVTTGVVFTSAGTPDANGYTTIIASGLTANTQYWYQAEVDGVLNTANTGSFKTDVTVGTAKSFRVAFSSCLTSGNATTTAFDNIIANAPELMLHLGDWHYDNDTTTSAAAHRNSVVNAINGNAGLKSALRNIPFDYVWSDHDSGSNDWTGGPAAWTPSYNAAYRDLVPFEAALPNAGGVYHSFGRGRVKFIMTDGRSFKSPAANTDDANKTMFGAAQEAWIANELADPNYPVKIIALDVPWVFATTAGDDKWGGYTNAANKLVAAIAAANAKVFLIHGDAHSLCADDGTSVNNRGGLPVAGAAPLGNSTSLKGGPYSAGHYPNPVGSTEQQHGLLDITDTGGNTITVKFSGRDKTNTERIVLTKTFDVGTSLNKAKLGTATIAGMKVGTASASAAYLGTTKVWP